MEVVRGLIVVRPQQDAGDAGASPAMPVATDAGDTDHAELESFDALRRQIIDQSFALIMDQPNVPELVEVLKLSALATSTPDGGTTLIWVDCNLSGETITAPSLRKPPLNKELVTKLINAILTARKDSDWEAKGTLPAGDVWMCLDAGSAARFEGLYLFATTPDHCHNTTNW